MQAKIRSSTSSIAVTHWPSISDNLAKYGGNYLTDTFDISQNGSAPGEVRIDTTNGMMYYWGNRSWNAIEQGTVDISVVTSAEADEVFRWGLIKMKEEKRAEILKTQYPELKAAHDHYQQLLNDITVADKLTDPNTPSKGQII